MVLVMQIGSIRRVGTEEACGRQAAGNVLGKFWPGGTSDSGQENLKQRGDRERGGEEKKKEERENEDSDVKNAR